ncbi:MAG: hypothetical protein GX442_11855 [Candidatus Riflebacteria bacterium]|nr:hypothetical protein [Candidatus Riflebacteria bacterium]
MRRMSWVWLLVVGMLTWTIGAGQAGEIALVTDRAGEVEVTVGSGSSWAPQVGETLPEGAVIKVPAGGLLKLFHLGMNKELILPEKAEATLQAAGLVSSIAYQEGDALAALPGSLSLEAASQQQLGAVNPQRMDSPLPPPPPAPPSPAPPSPAPSSSAPPSPAPVVVETEKPVLDEAERERPMETEYQEPLATERTKGGPGTGSSIDGSDQGSASEEGAEGFAPQPSSGDEGGGEPEGQSLGASPKPARSRAIQGLAPSLKKGKTKTPPVRVRLALPRDLLPADFAQGVGVPMQVGGQDLPPLESVAEDRLGSHSWVILTGTVPGSEGPATVSLALVPPHRLEGPVDPAVAAGTGLVMTALRLEATGCRLQAAAVWVDLAGAGTVSPEIAGRHLNRLAAALSVVGN